MYYGRPRRLFHGLRRNGTYHVASCAIVPDNDDQDREVMTSLPRTRPVRRSAKRSERPATAAGSAAAAATPKAKSKGKASQAKAKSAAKAKSNTTAKASAKPKSTATPRGAAASRATSKAASGGS